MTWCANTFRSLKNTALNCNNSSVLEVYLSIKSVSYSSQVCFEQTRWGVSNAYVISGEQYTVIWFLISSQSIPNIVYNPDFSKAEFWGEIAQAFWASPRTALGAEETSSSWVVLQSAEDLSPMSSSTKLTSSVSPSPERKEALDGRNMLFADK